MVEESLPRKLRVVVLFGGRSEEHEVSCISARHVAEALNSDQYEVIPIGITKDGRWLLPEASRRVLDGAALEIPRSSFQAEGAPVSVVQNPPGEAIVSLSGEGIPAVGRPDVVFPVLHGPFGEDGTVQGLLELSDVPFVGTGVLGSALGMDKEKMKLLFRSQVLPTASFQIIREYEWEADPDGCLARTETLGFPMFTKPANLGSSVGISKCADSDALRDGVAEAFLHDRKVIVEESISGREIECGVLGNDYPEASVCGEVIPSQDFYDYRAKYVDGSSKVIIPADLPDEVSEKVRSLSIAAFQAIDAEGLARVDFFYDSGGRGVVVNEINTMPGFTPISMFPRLWDASGVPYDKLIDRLIELAINRHTRKRRADELPPPAELPAETL